MGLWAREWANIRQSNAARPIFARGAETTAAVVAKLAPYQAVAIHAPVTHMALFGGVGVGKSYTLAHFSIDHFLRFPELKGFIGANTYDQLNQATLFELLYWLDHYGIDWCIHQRPPKAWGGESRFAKYNNILSVRHPRTKEVVNAFVRVLSAPNPLRGIEFSWYAIDETRDTPRNTHDVLLSRMRESSYMRGLIGTTTNGKDWAYERFVSKSDGRLYGAMHVPTLAAVELGILPREYYDAMVASYSELQAEQELWAKHVNVQGGRAYYASGDWNRTPIAPWGDRFPNPDRPLIIGCDFNFSPAPCVWMVGQLGPGLKWQRHLHWFGELSEREVGTEQMTRNLVHRYPGFYFRIFGDASGTVGTTSNAGLNDYAQMAKVLLAADAVAGFSIDEAQHNPLVKDRIENMNAKMRNSLGETSMTWDPQACPQFDRDMDVVGWKPSSSQKGKGKLDDGGDCQRTHASDAAGYAVYKVLPPFEAILRATSVPSPTIGEAHQNDEALARAAALRGEAAQSGVSDGDREYRSIPSQFASGLG